jgi:isopentenyl phosphate kinase
MGENTNMAPLIFLKLGGSLITDKHRPHTCRRKTLARLAEEIASALHSRPDLQLVIGHGSGSFGHVPGQKYSTRQGVLSTAEWKGFAEVWHAARTLNQMVVEALYQAGLPVIAMPPSAAAVASAGRFCRWELEPLQRALSAGLVPVVNGDVLFDERQGGTILSTEDVFIGLAQQMRPAAILIAGVEAGVWADFPVNSQLIPEITPYNYAKFSSSIYGSRATDVTGGMAAKVESMLALVKDLPGLDVRIFSGATPGAVEGALLGRPSGTLIHEGRSTI